ncbi:LLM class F420-dependent oxidoreductase [Halioglobus japonicus]|uniref:TIGR03619 family F420-dependent LLM class oxidoreductase n=2 Tax=Halioglobus japonicus TaxID=930805 RepID=A0AAP8MHB5_9GAMM|nr:MULTISPECIES: LLM class F420-dependent oxidoreductase [Halioglobus]PLW87831.1 TIGR03619 family F420-dependent LLM class oxidoreductase [Halioglobus japonicus]GHD06324.1 LLM class F420-dependent oxidoreductase [Halioglobus japonicus]
MHLAFSSMNTPNDPHPAELARALEDRGFESLWYGEHSHIPCSRATPYPPGGEMPDPYRQMMDPYLSLMTAANATTTLKLGTGIALLMERDIFAQAKTIATLDRLSGGRVMIGTGVGWNQEEFENASPHPFKKRYTLLRETVEATRALWTEEQAGYKGTFVKFDPVWSDPKPLQVGGPKIFLGAMGPVGVKHAAAWADGWYPVDVALGDVAASIAAFKEQVREAGRNPDEVEINIQIMDTSNMDKLKEYRDMGIQRATIGVNMELWDQPEAALPMIDEFAKVIPDLAA